ncbi:hypothetical protein BCY91_02145 [Pelobium manganitolerans]|uniref:Glycosyl transferase family 1 domain-containing protein n=1 Tax=Pelobium manganitolerans TaxID=1842495 RepID=A0A419SCB0_9SPHI|nr:glycosyltransferase [Pelobium manganitolerans]RKD20439.1 hypothetical protein BCY91_02145 [Pelobium manganitolerans]
MKNRILIIAPLPPPMTGNSLPVKILYDNLKQENDVEVINLSKSSYSAGINSLSRIIQIFKIFGQVYRKGRNKDLIYFTISESFAGNLKDILLYLLLKRKLKVTVIHMFGGAGMKRILDKKSGLQFYLNSFFLNRLRAIIVEGQTQADFFAKVVDPRKIHVVNNFAENYLFNTKSAISAKFQEDCPIRVLFISNFIYGKGYKEIVEAYALLDKEQQRKTAIDFAGGFGSIESKKIFLNSIKNFENLHYHGLVSGNEKQQLYHKAHVFCLPTYYPYEGQPFCILEAYASGCVLVTTNHSGIKDVFQDKKNGFEARKMDVESLKNIFEIISNSKNLFEIANSNYEYACKHYRSERFVGAMRTIFGSIIESRTKL